MTYTGTIANFSAAINNRALFKLKQNITCKAADGGTKYVEIMLLLKYVTNFLKDS